MSQSLSSTLAVALSSVGLALALVAGSQDTEKSAATADVMEVEVFDAEGKLITSAMVDVESKAFAPVQSIREIPYINECSSSRTPPCTTSMVEEGVRIQLTRVSDQKLNVDTRQMSILSTEKFSANGQTIELPKVSLQASSFTLDLTDPISQTRPLPGGGKVVITTQPR